MILKVTPGAPDSNSLVTLDEADEYIAANFSEADAAIWDNLEESKKSVLLVLGANVLGYLPFSGKKTYAGQAQLFPRHLWSGVPDPIKAAQIELTMNVVLRADLVKPSITSGVEATSKISNVSLAGIISVAFGDTGDDTGTILDQLTRNMNLQTSLALRPYMTSVRGGVIGSTSRWTPIPFEG